MLRTISAALLAVRLLGSVQASPSRRYGSMTMPADDVKLEPRQDTTDPPNATELCDTDTTFNKETWEQFRVGDFIDTEVLALQPFTSGIQDRFIQLAGGINNYACGVDAQCEITGNLQDACPQNPQAVFALTAMANFNNFFRAVRDSADKVLNSLSDGAASMVTTFAPELDPDDTGDPLKFVGVGFIVASALISLVPGLAPLGVAFTIEGVTIPLASQGDDAAGAAALDQFDSFQKVSDTILGIREGLVNAAESFARDRLENVPSDDNGASPDDPTNPSSAGTVYQQDPHELPSILRDGSFAAPIVDLGADFDSGLRTFVAGSAINSLWNKQEVVIGKFNKDTIAKFGEGLDFDPCDGDNLFLATDKFCDTDGTMYALQQLKSAPSNPSDFALEDGSSLEVSGFTSLADYDLNPHRIIQSAVQTQDSLEEYFAVPETQGYIDRFLGDPRNVNFRSDDAVLWNMPYCDLTVLESPASLVETDSNFVERICRIQTDSDEGKAHCIFNLLLMCACPDAPQLGGEDWPYDTAGRAGVCSFEGSG